MAIQSTSASTQIIQTPPITETAQVSQRVRLSQTQSQPQIPPELLSSEAAQLNVALQHSKRWGFKPVKNPNEKPLGNVIVLIFSLSFHIYQLALSASEGLREQNLSVKLFQTKDTFGEETVLRIQRNKPRPNVPVISNHVLNEADGILIGLPSSSGISQEQIGQCLSSLCSVQNKLVSVFFGHTASLPGEAELQPLDASQITLLIKNGCVFFNPETNQVDNNAELSKIRPMLATNTANDDGEFISWTALDEGEASRAKSLGVYFAKEVVRRKQL